MKPSIVVVIILLFTAIATKTWTVSAAFSTGNGNPETNSIASSTSSISFDSIQNKRVLVVGGSGRVGGSCVTQFVKRGARVQVGGTTEENFLNAKKRWVKVFPSLQSQIDQVSFASLNREDVDSVKKILMNDEGDNYCGFDLVVHTAGPFQGKVKVPNGVLEACVHSAVPYLDVCDDYCTASAAKSKYFFKAVDNGTPCIISTGCWPGVSSLMAKQLSEKVLSQKPNLEPKDLKVHFSFFTAGSGGAGVTLLVATFLILAEKALVVINGRRREVDAMKEYDRVNFGEVVGDKKVAHLNLLETASVSEILGIGNVQAKFGTAPDFWNTLLGLMAQLPRSLLLNEQLMRNLSIFAIPIVRWVDYFAGATNAMRCDVMATTEKNTTTTTTDDIRATAIYAHENLEPCVGECVVAFAAAVLSGAVLPGVWFPEEAIRGGHDAQAVLHLASVGAHTTDVSSSPSLKLFKEDVWGSKCGQ